MNALSSLNTTLTHYVDNEYGLGEDIVYTDSSGVDHNTRLVNEFKEQDVKNRDIIGDEISDTKMFLIKLDFVPKKNEQIIKDGNTYYIDRFEQVSSETFRLYVTSNTQFVPSPSERYEI